MGKRWKLGILVLGCPATLVLAYLLFMSLALRTLEAKYDDLRDGLTIEETDRMMGGVFVARSIDWDDIPEIYTGHYVERNESVARDYRFFGVSELSIVVIYDEKGLSYLHIPVYE